jgi:HemY protein
MRWVFSLLMLFSLAVALALFVEFNHGNIAIFWPPYRIDLSINVAVIGLILAFIAGYLFLLAAGRLVDLPNRVQRYRQKRQDLSSSIAFRDAVLALFEGRFGRAERLSEIATRDTKYSEAASLVAARATHRMREFERRDSWMKRGTSVEDTANDALSNAQLMTMAELAIEDRSESSARDAIAAVKTMQARGARQIHAQRTALRAYELTENWSEVIRLCRLLYKRNALHATASRGLLSRAHRALMKTMAGDLGALKAHWSQMSSAEQAWPEVVEPAAQAFLSAGDAPQAIKLIAKRLDDSFSSSSVELYASIEAIPAKERLQKLEQMLKKVGPDPAIHKALGRVCLSLELWGKAEDNLVRSHRALPTVEALLLLAEVYEKTDRTDKAFAVYREAAQLSHAGNSQPETASAYVN